MPKAELTPGDQFLHGNIDRIKKARPYEKGQTPESRDLQDIDQAIDLLGTLRADAFAQREEAWEKLRHAIQYLEEARNALATKVEEQEK
jgi:hypothetical protein